MVKSAALAVSLHAHRPGYPVATLSESFDPWGPIWVALFDIGNADFVEAAVSATGLIGAWRPLGGSDGYSHGTRIRARRPEITAAFYALPSAHRGVFVQRLLLALFERPDGAAIRAKLEDRLGAIGWGLRDDGLLVTQDALVSEAFFPPGSHYDAYISLRDLFRTAKAELVIIDAWLGSAVLSTLRSVSPPTLRVRFLTVARNLRPDFNTELAAFRSQMTSIQIEVRATGDFHDRFAVLDGSRCFHIGASIKDAGTRAFMVSEIEDPANRDILKRTVETAWQAGQPL